MHQVDCFSPTVYDLLSYLFCLKDKLKSPGAIMNYFSTVKIWVKAGPGKSSSFDAPELATMKRGIIKNSTHIPGKAPSISPQDFKQVIDFLVQMNPCPYVLVVGLLLTYFTMARQSNIVMTTNSTDTFTHVIKFGDVQLLNNVLLVTIRSTKTQYSSAPPDSL